MTTLTIDRYRYRVLTDLFRKLGDRQEISIGRASIDMRTVLPIYFAVGASISLVMLAARLSIRNPLHTSVWPYLGIFLLVTVFFLFNFLLSEVANLLVNPVEGLALAHQPVDGLTYLAAKLSHLFRFLVYAVFAINLIPAFAPVFFPAGAHLVVSWFYPLIHIAAAYTVAFFMALSMCCVFGLLIRVMPAARVKESAQTLQLMPIVIMISSQVAESLGVSGGWIIGKARPIVESPWLPWIIAALVPFMIVFTVRSLSVDYLTRVVSIVHGGSARIVKIRRSWVSACIARLPGGQPNRAGFEFVREMMMRDWQFKRQVIPMIPMMIGLFVVIFRSSASPFSSSFSAAHLIPHAFGTLLLWITLFLSCGSHPKGSWIFLQVSEGTFAPFARGVFLFMWFAFVLTPHLILAPILAWLWGTLDAILFVTFSAATTSLYLSLQLRLIDGLPFGRRPDPTRNAVTMPLLLGCAVAALIAVGIQHLLLFRSSTFVAFTTITIASLAFVITRSSLGYFEVAIRHTVATTSHGSTFLYTETE